MASPTPIKQPRNEDDVIRPAVEGTVSVLRACADANCVKRVVLTSSIAAIAGIQILHSILNDGWGFIGYYANQRFKPNSILTPNSILF